MEEATKLDYLKTILGVNDTRYDAEFTVYLKITAQEIINWKYSLIGIPEDAVVPPEDEIAQIMACAAGYGHKGAPDQLLHIENTVHRTFQHGDMLMYIRDNVIAYAAVR